MRPVRALTLSEEEQRDLRELHLLTAKPVMYVCNVAENGFHDNPLLAAVEKRAATEGAVVVPVCAAIEAEIAQLEENERTEFLAELGLDEPGLNRVIRAAYRLQRLPALSSIYRVRSVARWFRGPSGRHAWDQPLAASEARRSRQTWRT